MLSPHKQKFIIIFYFVNLATGPLGRTFLPFLRPLRTKLIKCQFWLGSEPRWAWVCSILDRQNAINELVKCVLGHFSLLEAR